MIAALVTHHRELLEIARRRKAAVTFPLGVLAVILLAAFVTLILPAMQLPTADPHVSLGTRITEVENLFRGTFNGTSVYQYMTGSVLDHSTLMGWLIPMDPAGLCCRRGVEPLMQSAPGARRPATRGGLNNNVFSGAVHRNSDWHCLHS